MYLEKAINFFASTCAIYIFMHVYAPIIEILVQKKNIYTDMPIASVTVYATALAGYIILCLYRDCDCYKLKKTSQQ